MKTLTKYSTRLMEKWLPDPLIFVILLTAFIFLLGVFTTPASPVEMVSFFGTGFWGLLAFTAQMAMVLLTGHVLAMSSPFKKLLKRLAKLPKSAGQAIIMVSVVAAVACVINWGFGLVIGALFAKEMARTRDDVDYRLLIASAYSGFLVWHGGLSGSIPLTIATKGHPFEDKIGIIPITDTIFSLQNIITVLSLIIAIPILNYLMHPKKEDRFIVDSSVLDDTPSDRRLIPSTPSEKIENSMILSLVAALLGFSYVIWHFATKGFDLNLDIVNLIFLFAGFLLHKTPRNYIDATEEAVKGVAPILIQFPFYGGLMAMMTQSGIAGNISNLFVNISSQDTFQFLAFISAGIVNFFVPSGGGQWAVQAPIMIEAAHALHVPDAKMAMAIAWGDAWTNMIQPFWALPALAIAGLKAKDIMGYCLFVMIVSGIIISLAFLFIP
ncbi:short-chain fatty acid transporter [Macrococcus lamae]|uniref:Short-chain fatty acid transporter n=1 Tax=Macrococcus lamae TaxID=198484 RepID=A0A4R6BSG9_9STAP|nr:short-chain fatty acid transporter [Macrococcus lamae]TDM07015.1 short-chain fatty acid transporter [Macrococcus lamae]